MANKKTISISEDEYIKIIETIQAGFTHPSGVICRPNDRIATILVLEANLGMRISDILQMTLEKIIKDGERYRLDLYEKKTGKKRTFTVPLEIYSYIQSYAIRHNIGNRARLFPIQVRVVQAHLKRAVEYLQMDERISTHSFRKYFATDIYRNNEFDIELVRTLLQHSSVVTTQKYIGIGTKELENALQKHIKLI